MDKLFTNFTNTDGKKSPSQLKGVGDQLSDLFLRYFGNVISREAELLEQFVCGT